MKFGIPYLFNGMEEKSQLFDFAAKWNNKAGEMTPETIATFAIRMRVFLIKTIATLYRSFVRIKD